MNSIAKRRAEIETVMDEMYKRMDALRDECKHVNVRKEARADTGNWDRSADRYWYHCSCPDCGVVWQEPQ